MYRGAVFTICSITKNCIYSDSTVEKDTAFACQALCCGRRGRSCCSIDAAQTMKSVIQRAIITSLSFCLSFSASPFHWLSRGLCMIAWVSVSPRRCTAIVHLSLLHLYNCMHEVSSVNPSCWQVVCSCSAGYSGKPLAEGYWFFLSWQTSWKITQRGAG